MPDFNTGPEQREPGVVVPDGTFARLKMHMKPGGYTKPGEHPQDNGLFKLNADTGSVSIEADYSIVGGRHNGVHVYQWHTIDGGSRDDAGNSIAGNITKGFYRAVCESRYGVPPTDMSPTAMQFRSPPAYAMLEGIEFFARLGIEAGGPRRDGSGNYPDKNFIAHVIVPGEPEYPLLAAGQELEPKPSGIRQPRNSTAAASAPGTGEGNLWGGGGPAPAAPPAASWTQQPAPAPYQPGAPQAHPPQQQPTPWPGAAGAAAPPAGQPAPNASPPAGYAQPDMSQGQPSPAPVPGQPVPNGASPSNPPAYQPAPAGAPPADAPAWMRG